MKYLISSDSLSSLEFNSKTNYSLSRTHYCVFLFVRGLNICLLAMEVTTKAKAGPSFYAAAEFSSSLTTTADDTGPFNSIQLLLNILKNNAFYFHG